MTRRDDRRYRPLRHLYNVGLAVSQLGNAVLAGDPDESLSGRAGKGRAAGSPFWTAAAWLIDALWWPVQRDHCARSIELDEGDAAAQGRLGAWLLLWVAVALLLSMLFFQPAAAATPEGAEAEAAEVDAEERTPDLLWLELQCWPGALGIAALELKGLALERVLVDQDGVVFEWWGRPDGAAVLVLAHRTPGGLPYRCGLGEQSSGQGS